MASIGVKPDNLRDLPVTRAQPLLSPSHRLSLVSGKLTLLLKGPSLDRIPPREKVSSRSQLFPERVLLLKGPSLSNQLRKRVHSQHSKPCFGSMDQHSSQPLAGCREVTNIRGQSHSMHFKLPTSDSVNEDNWEQEMIQAKSLDQEKVWGYLVAHSEAWNCITHDTFVLSSMQGHLIQFNRKPPLVHPTEKCEVQVPKDQQQEMNRQRKYQTTRASLPIPDPKEEWQEQIHYEPQAIELVHKMHQIQDDDPEMDQRVSQEQTMGRSDGYQISVLSRSNASQTQVFPAFLIQGEGLPLQDSPIRPINSSENVHLMDMANTFILPQARDNAVSLSR